MAGSNKHWRQRQFEPSQEWCFKEDDKSQYVVGIDFIIYDLPVYTDLQVLSKTVSRLWFYAYKKYKNGNSARHTSAQRHIRPAICSGRSDKFSSGTSRKLDRGCPNGTNTPRGDNIQDIKISIVTLTFDLLTSKSIGHILASWGVCMWSFMMIDVKGKQLCARNHFQ